MMYREDEDEDKKKDGTISDEVIGEALDEDADEEDILTDAALLDDEKAWE